MAEDRNFVVYRASAGSGKTWVLVKEYLKLCLQFDSPSYYRSILAVTFTNKAASEMRERIMLRLQGFAGLNPKEFDAHMEKELCAELNLDKVELGRRSRNTLSHMLHHYSDLKISTIDSFVHQLVRAFARDIDIAPDFDIELDSDLVVQIAVDNVLDRVGRDPETTDMLLRYAKTMLEDEKNWNFRNDLADFASGLTVEGTNSKVALLKKFEGHQFVEIHKQLSGLSAAFEKELTTVTQQALDLLASAQLDADAFSGKTIYNYIVALNQLNTEAMSKDLATFNKVLFGGEEFFPKSKAKLYADAFAPIDQELRGYCLKIHHLLKEEPYSHYLRVKKVRAQVYPLAVLHLVNDAIHEWKDQNSTLLIGDFNRLINQVILNNPAPFIYERIGQRFRHFLIDEFQDTSIVQWQNFIPLLENSLATHHFNLIVGDGKQSIYRWRGGEVDQFNLLPDIYKKPSHIFDNAEAAFHREIDVRPREQNFRSAPEVVDFNNRLFDVIAPMLGDHASVYAGHRQEPVKSFKGWVTYEKPEKEKVFDAIEEAIRMAREDGFRPADITILVRGNKDASMIVEELQFREGFDEQLITEDSFLIERDAQVLFVVNFMQWLENPTLVDVQARTLIIGRSLLNGPYTFDEALDRYLTNERSLDMNTFFADHVPDFDVNHLKGRAHNEIMEWWFAIFRENGHAPNVFQEFALDHMRAFEELHRRTGVSFREWWAQKHSKLMVQSQSGNGIRILTIHKAKGLQFPVVIFPIFSTMEHNLSSWIDQPINGVDLPVAKLTYRHEEAEKWAGPYREEAERAILDNANVLYVALTRAEKRLHILAPEQPKGISTANMLDTAIKQAFAGKVEFGARVPEEDTHHPEIPTHDPGLLTGDFRSRMRVSFRSGKLWSDEGRGEQVDRGICVHAILERGESEAGMRQMANELIEGGAYTRAMVEDSLSRAQSLVSHPEIRDLFFDGGLSRVESEVVTPDGHSLRPDRIIESATEIRVVDFKTGQPRATHQSQVQSYLHALGDVYDKPLKGYLLYTEGAEVVEVV